jgi:GNAT superfamily N-acetyltransferase
LCRAGPFAYFEAVCRQWGLLATDAGRAVGMMSFRPHHFDDALGPFCPATYLSTIAVLPPYRRNGTARCLYEHLIAHSESIGDVSVATRTWSTNRGHLTLLAELGFSLTARLVDHRGPGVDTVYFARPA